MKSTIIAPSTPFLKSAMALLRISGDKCIDIAKDFLHLKSPKPRYAYHTRFFIDNKEIDDVIAIYYKAPKSYTGEDMLEISFHGNPLILEKAINALIKYGCEYAKAGEFTKRAFLNGKMGLEQAKSVELIINANTEKALENALALLKGKFSDYIENIRKAFIHIIANLEADIEFGYEDIEPLNINDIKYELKILKDNLKDFYKKLGDSSYLYDGIKIAIVGKPNVGKSSLFNELLRKKRSIVSDIPGTTRDYVEDRFELAGFPVKLIDTAGIRKAYDPVEAQGIELSIEHIKQSDIVIFVVDVSNSLTEEDFYIYNLVKSLNTIFVLNKMDIGINEKTLDFFKENVIIISVREHKNFDILTKKILDMLSLTEDTIYVSKRNKFLISNAITALENALEQNSMEIIMLYIRESLSYLEEILGLITDENILDEIFSTFCIGK